jgi:hypothetical protein
VLVRKLYKIAEGDWASGEIPRRCGPSHISVAPDEAFDDMALYVKHTKGLVALTGCGHAGVENIMEYGLQVTGTDKLYAVIGGRTRACRGYSLHRHCGYRNAPSGLPTAAKSGVEAAILDPNQQISVFIDGETRGRCITYTPTRPLRPTRFA